MSEQNKFPPHVYLNPLELTMECEGFAAVATTHYTGHGDEEYLSVKEHEQEKKKLEIALETLEELIGLCEIEADFRGEEAHPAVVNARNVYSVLKQIEGNNEV